jgi:DNA-binding LacI/PurR family transcriptional regulator
MYASGIIHTSLLTDSVIEMLLDSEIPTIVANSYGNCPFDTVHGDRERSGAYIATEYLINSGHKHIAFAGGEKDTITGQSRLSGYMRAMEKAGLEIKDEYISQNSFNHEGGYESGKRFLGLHHLPEAVCCANDLIALGVMTALRDAGVRIPEDISVIGVDNIPYAALVSPPLTTVVNDSHAFSQASVTMLLERITGSCTEPPREVSIPRQLIVRQSVKILT